jgi:acetylornithine deacetylase/succinyl-diaminopimelate desuccinylase-like protein
VLIQGSKMSTLDNVLSQIDTNIDTSIERLFELIRIPSISTDPTYRDDCLAAANWVQEALSGIGFDASVRPTSGLPMVVGHHTSENLPDSAPHVLFYGHYDVQPADPLDMWNTPPFEPVRGVGPDNIEKIYARGASDDKGQLMTFLEACRAWMEINGQLPVKVTVLFEGEEESGSPSLAAFLDENADELRHDVALICDTNMWDADTPAITTRLRGIMHDELTVTGPSRDLHSGLYGGVARNPIRVLARIIADLHDEDGQINIPGFYDGVKTLPPETRDSWQALNFPMDEFLGDVGLAIPAGEIAVPALEQLWARPTCDMNGIIAGYTGEGTKTVIPSQASAKVSFRLVAGQDPEAIRESFRAFVTARLPADCTANFDGHGAGTALEVPLDNPFLPKAADAMSAEFGKQTVLMGNGASIPIATSFKEKLSMDSLLIGFALNDDQIHSPNEKYNMPSFIRGTRSWARILQAFAS